MTSQLSPHGSPILLLLLLAAGSPLPSSTATATCQRPAVEHQLEALLDSALDDAGINATLAGKPAVGNRARVVRLSLTGLAVIGLSDGVRGGSGGSPSGGGGGGGVLQWSGSFLLAWNDTKSRAGDARKNRTDGSGASAEGDWAPEIGVESDLPVDNNASIADIWSRRHASTRAVRPNGEVTLRFRAALRTRCRVSPGSPGYPFDTRRCDLRLGRRRQNRRRLRLLLSNTSLLVAASSSWSVTGVRVLRRRKQRRRSQRIPAGGGGRGESDDDDLQLFRLEVARSLAYYWVLAALPLATTLTAAAAAALAQRLAGSRESGQRCLDCGCVVVGCCLLLLGQASVYFTAGRQLVLF